MSKKTLRLLGIVLTIVFTAAAIAGCGGSQTQEPAKQEQKSAAPAAPAAAGSNGLKSAEFEQPVLITSIGQSADAQMVKALAERNGLKYTYDNTASPSALENVKTLMLVLGGSSKGMGAAGVNMDQEDKRAKALIAKAKEAKIKVIAAHVGGASRRGDLTNRFIPLIGEANYAIVVADGDNDKAFTKAAGGKVPIDFPANITDVAKYLKAAFK